MPRLERLRLDHAPALLAFERENRAYFAASIPDRGDAYFEWFDDRLRESLAAQEAGLDLFHLVVDGAGSVLGRFNLLGVAQGSAELGYRVAERAAGRGLATSAVREVCALAATEYGLKTLRARTTAANAGSRTVLARTGFLVTGDIELNGRPGLRFALDLPAADAVLPAGRRATGQGIGSAAGLIGD
ncbi:GNAT family N-acetyltransferase [Streptomyces sp. NPDC005784]|uniref:GNAT family N-acetyltransferase n=1 Tax=Streptomyces sp. NPDC005784 TaxID=3364731 RepID=UPI0036AB7E56